jgi:hypothetical protein
MTWLPRTATLVVVLLGVHALLKFGAFFLPYATRRAALDKSYGTATTATRSSDVWLLVLSITVAALVFARGVDGVGFLGGLWVGATLIQVYFHRFHEPLPAEHAPPPVVSPIKLMSYAIQDAPWRPWREILVFALLVVASLTVIALA